MQWLHVRRLAVKAGVWATETEISAAQWAMRRGKQFSFLLLIYKSLFTENTVASKNTAAQA